jgi:hypothetical protein
MKAQGESQADAVPSTFFFQLTTFDAVPVFKLVTFENSFAVF